MSVQQIRSAVECLAHVIDECVTQRSGDEPWLWPIPVEVPHKSLMLHNQFQQSWVKLPKGYS